MTTIKKGYYLLSLNPTYSDSITSGTQLAKVQNVNLDSETNTLSFDAVDNAESYDIYVDNTLYATVGNNTTASDYTFKINGYMTALRNDDTIGSDTVFAKCVIKSKSIYFYDSTSTMYLFYTTTSKKWKYHNPTSNKDYYTTKDIYTQVVQIISDTTVDDKAYNWWCTNTTFLGDKLKIKKGKYIINESFNLIQDLGDIYINGYYRSTYAKGQPGTVIPFEYINAEDNILTIYEDDSFGYPQLRFEQGSVENTIDVTYFAFDNVYFIADTSTVQNTLVRTALKTLEIIEDTGVSKAVYVAWVDNFSVVDTPNIVFDNTTITSLIYAGTNITKVIYNNTVVFELLTALATPTSVTHSSGTIRWNRVSNATKYAILVEDVCIGIVTGTSVTRQSVTTNNLGGWSVVPVGAHQLKIIAIADGYKNSEMSSIVVFTKNPDNAILDTSSNVLQTKSGEYLTHS
jgi:acyl-CoA synthetase (AMP-forming)/AMP-acid ligase II